MTPPKPDAVVRPDGWPLCPTCGNDELYSNAVPPTIETISGCYVCGACPGPFADDRDCPIHSRHLATRLHAPKPDALAPIPECKLPPHGWICTRGSGHEGPCAATPSLEDTEDRYVTFLRSKGGVIYHANSDSDGAFKVYRWAIVKTALDALAQAEERATKAEAENTRLCEALEWYAGNIERHKFYIVTAPDRSFLSDLADWGNKAREALAPSTETESESK